MNEIPDSLTYRFCQSAAFLFCILTLAGTLPAAPPDKSDQFAVSGARGIEVDGRRQLAPFEVDSYGPLPFPELVARFIDDEITLLLKRQREDGSFEMLAGRTTEAGGTVDGITLASLCGYSLRKHDEVNPEAIGKAISKALDYVVYMVRSGKLRNGRDAAWRYAYAFRFLVHEYPHIKDEKIKGLVEDACLFLLHGLDDLQQGTVGQKSIPVSWNFPPSPGILVEDHEETGRAFVTGCTEDSPAFKAGVRQGDFLLTADGVEVHTTLRYYLQQMRWKSGDTIALQISREGKTVACELSLPSQFPGTPGFSCEDGAEGEVVVDAFGPLGDFFAGALAPGDRIVKIDGDPVKDAATFDGMKWYSGQRIEIERERGGKSVSVEVKCRPVKSASLGVALKGGLDQSGADGFAIQKLAKDSCLQKAGLEPGDRILRIDETRVLNRRHFSVIERGLWGGQPITVTYLAGDEREMKTVDVTTGSRSHDEWLEGYHGITISNRQVKGASILKVAPGSPADDAGCVPDDVITEINGEPVTSPRGGLRMLSAMFAGEKAVIKVDREGEEMKMAFEIHRPSDSPWISNSADHGGGWAYYTHVRGGTTFLTSDILRDLIRARKNLPFHIPDHLIRRPFEFLSKLRMRQPNATAESYRYDGGGSFWGVKDIRGDVGRLPAAELSCVMFSDSGLPVVKGMERTQAQLAAALEEWLVHRGILEYAKSGGHLKFSIAPWYLPYSYMSTLAAAEYLTSDDDLRERVYRASLKTYFKYSQIQHIDELGGEGWQIGYYEKKQLLRSCLLLDGLATMKHLYRPTLKISDPSLQGAKEKLDAMDYGAAYTLAISAKDSGKVSIAEAASLIKVTEERFEKRLEEIKEIQKIYYRDALRYLEEMEPHFKGHPRWDQAEKLKAEWESKLPDTKESKP